ncbi:hypothetical protein AB9M62_21265 [Bacillales bacterium AN1005]
MQTNFLVKDVNEVEKGWHENAYRSPIPLHDQKSSLGLASRIAWILDEDGYGQYALVFNGNITTIVFLDRTIGKEVIDKVMLLDYNEINIINQGKDPFSLKHIMHVFFWKRVFFY